MEKGFGNPWLSHPWLSIVSLVLAQLSSCKGLVFPH